LKSKLSIALFLCIIVVPIMISAAYSLLYSLGLTGLLSQGWTLTYWQQVVTDGNIWISLLYSLAIALSAMGISLTAALYLSLRHKAALQQKTTAYLLFLPLGIPAVVAAFFTYQMLAPSGLLSRVSYAWGLSESAAQFPSLVNDSLAIGIVITHIILAIPYFTVLFNNIYLSENVADLEQVSNNLGSTRRQTLRVIVIPLLLKRAMASIVMFLIFVMGSYEIPLLLGVSDPRMLSPLIADKMFRFDLTDKPEAHAMLLIYLLSVIAINLFVLKRTRLYAS
jgi:putative spermidine/putrescine transport system permease protein